MKDRSERNLILCAAAGYSWKQLEPFVRSLEKTSFNGTVAMLTGQLEKEEEKHLASAGIVNLKTGYFLLHLPVWFRRKFFSRKLGFIHRHYGAASEFLPLPENFRRLARFYAGRFFHHIACSRYFYYYHFLLRHRNAFDRVMLTDVRDVLFQTDPFSYPVNNPLCFFLEHRTTTIGGHEGNANWIRYPYGETILEAMEHNQVSCSGVSLGTTEGMLEYLKAMGDQLVQITDTVAGCDGFDQGVHNFLIGSRRFPEAGLFENGAGPVLTMHGTPADDFRWDDQQHLINHDGSVIPILHQYDRHPEIASKLFEARGLPSPP